MTEEFVNPATYSPMARLAVSPGESIPAAWMRRGHAWVALNHEVGEVLGRRMQLRANPGTAEAQVIDRDPG